MVESHSNSINDVPVPFLLRQSFTIAFGIAIFADISGFLP